ncbi:MAG TPA: hypothetical protein VGQ46_05820 [Thermoanaerobaculia bacterium]|jgi:hypothetical protein|nr:hypothetical protein [Thermoanaerobaculia bacterium]
MTTWRRGTYAVVIVWIVAMARLFIADVWDESSALAVFGDPHQSAAQLVSMILKTPLPFWRPIPTIFAALAIHVLPANVAWPFLRVVNILIILAAVALLVRALTSWSGRDDQRDFVFVFATLFSAGAIIVAGWFANIFDASVLLLIAWGLLLVTRRWFLEAGFIFGAAFFFKETAAMVLPLLLLLLAIDRIKLRDAIRTAIPPIAIGILYFGLRSLVVPFGSAADTHQFQLSMLLPTAKGLAESYWRETLWGSPGFIGYIVFAFSIAAMRTWRARAAFVAYAGAAVVLYLSMFAAYQGHDLVHYLMFVPRLYFIPVTLTLFVFAVDRRWWAVAVLAIPLLIGSIGTYTRYERFQRSYRNLYRYAATAPKPVTIDYAMKPLHDPLRGIEIGDFANAPLRLDPVNGLLVKK